MNESKNVDLTNLPDAPGCYIFWDSAGDCLYVGKSKRLKNRVRSYFNKNTPPKIQKLAKLIARIECRTAADEIDALYLEHSLIKTYRPPFNAQMKKDPHPHYICIDWRHAKPGLYISDIPSPGATGYGSFGSVYDAKLALAVIGRAWKVPSCATVHFDNPNPGRGCLNMHIGRCQGPCQPGISEGYRDSLIKAAAFMQGRGNQAISNLKREMKQAGQDLDFEKATKIRDNLRALQALQWRFAYQVPFTGRRLCVLIKGYHEPGFLLLYYKNGQLRQTARFNGPDDWPAKRDSFIQGMVGNAISSQNCFKAETNGQDYMYPSAATLEIRARKCYVDVTKTSKTNLQRRLDKALKRFIK